MEQEYTWSKTPINELTHEELVECANLMAQVVFEHRPKDLKTLMFPMSFKPSHELTKV